MENFRLSDVYYRVYKNEGDDQKTIKMMIPYDKVRNVEIFIEYNTLDIPEDRDFIAVHLYTESSDNPVETVILDCDFNKFYEAKNKYDEMMFLLDLDEKQLERLNTKK